MKQLYIREHSILRKRINSSTYFVDTQYTSTPLYDYICTKSKTSLNGFRFLSLSNWAERLIDFELSANSRKR